MKAEINFKDDKELRDFAKDMIRGAVKNISRQEIHDIATVELTKLRLNGEQPVRAILREEAAKILSVARGDYEVREVITKHISEKIESLTAEIRKRLDERLDTQIKKEVEAAVQGVIAKVVGIGKKE